MAVSGQLPPLLFGLLGGVYADRWDRRRTMAVVDVVRATVVGALAVAVDRAGVTALVVTAFLLATLGALLDAASFALLPAPAALSSTNGRLQAGTTPPGPSARGGVLTRRQPLPQPPWSMTIDILLAYQQNLLS